jgi:HAE1 family hydrophobic/amphiphilic exporter-1
VLRPIIRWCLSNRAVVVLLTLILMGGGVFSMTQLNQQLLPNIALPGVFILVPEQGAGPDQVDSDVSQPISNALTGLAGLKHVQTSSSQGFAEVSLIFDYGSDLKTDVANVNQKLAQVQLPDTAGKPLVQTFDSSTSPTMLYSLAARDGDLARISREAHDLVVPAISSVNGVATVGAAGTAQRQVTITLDAAKMASHGVSASGIQQALKGAQIDLPVGTTTLAGKTLPVQVVSTARTVDDLKKVVVSGGDAATAGAAAQAGQGLPAPARPVTLGDVATVQDATAATNGVSRANGAAALTLQVVATPDGNAIGISRDVKAQLSRLHLDSRDSLQLVYDNATYVQSSLNDLLIEGLAGAALAIIVIFFFLGSVRGTLVTAVSLPASILVALIGTKVAGYSLNVLTLAGLTIAIGRIVDDAIVVLENSYRHLQGGEEPRLAALNGASEVSMAIVSSTLTTVAVFLPIGLVGGFISLLFLSFSITVCVALLASLLVALTIIPVLVSIFLARRVGRPHREPILVRGYRPVIRWALRGPWRKVGILIATAALLVTSIAAATKLPVNLFDLGGSNELDGTVTLPAGTTVAQTSARLKAFEARAQADPDVRMVLVTIGNSTEGSISFAPSTNVASITVLSKDQKKSPALARRLQDELDSLYGRGNASIAVNSSGAGNGNTFQETISGNDGAGLKRASDMIVANLQNDHELTNIKSSLAADQPQLQVAVDPARAAAHGLTTQTVAQLLGPALGPQAMGKLPASNTPVVLQVDPTTTTADRLGGLELVPGVALKDVATVTNTMASETIQRDNGKQQLTVTAQIVTNDTSGASGRATQRIQNLHLPAGVGIATGGAADMIGTSFTSMFIAIGVAIAVVYLILVIFFRSVVTPLIILLTMPLSLIGGLSALYLFHQSLGLSALLGVLMLFGVVVSNGILLIDFTEKERRHDQPLREALLRAGSVRLRPILMTAVATIMALLPVAAGFSTGGGGGLISQSLAIVVEGGLVSSTVLTLVVVPVMYSIVRRRWRPRPAFDETVPAQAVDDLRAHDADVVKRALEEVIRRLQRNSHAPSDTGVGALRD